MASLPRSMSYSTLLRQYLAPDWRRAFALLVLLLVGAGLVLVSPALLASFIDAVVGVGQGNLLWLAALFLGVAVLSQGITIITNYLGTDIGLRATNQLRTDLMLHCLELDMAFHNRTTPGTLIERIDGDVSRLNQFLSTFALLLIKNALLLVGSLAAIALIDWRAGAALTLLVVVLLAGLEATRRTAIPAITRESVASAELFSVIEERLAGVEDLKANGATNYVLRCHLEVSQVWARTVAWSHTIAAVPGGVAVVGYAVAVALALIVAVWLVGTGAATIGAAYAIFRYLELMRWPIQQVGRQIQDMQQAGAAIIRLEELFSQHSTILERGDTRLPPEPRAVTFDQVSFAYPASPDEPVRYALHDLSFHLPAGATLGLLGRTGSGKTTVTRLLLRFYDPKNSSIHLGGTPIETVALRDLRRHIGLVTQEVQLFHATVRENLSLFDPSIVDERLHAVLAAVELDDWLVTLPNGLDTLLPPGGGLSAGQAQLLAVARVLLRDPALVILDEASSRLDPATEQRLEQAFARLLHGRTSIIIAHRLATVERADYIMILEDGQCVEFGLRIALAADPDSRFAQLLRVGIEEALA